MTNVYLLCATIGLAFVVLSALLGWVGGGDHGAASGSDAGGADVSNDFGTGGHGDAAAAHSGDSGAAHLPLFSPMAIATLVTGFGGSGLVFRYVLGDRPSVHLPAAAVAGAVLWLGTSFLMLKLVTLFEAPRVAREQEIYRQVAEVTVSIPDGGVGEIAYVVDGVRHTSPARCEAGTSLKAGERVRVARLAQGAVEVRAVSSLAAGPGFKDPSSKT